MTPVMLAEVERDVWRDFDGPVALTRTWTSSSSERRLDVYDIDAPAGAVAPIV